MKLETVNINDLISPDYNPRTITPEAMESLKTSLKEFDYIDPIIVNKHNMHIVGGNQRYLALKSMGWTELPVIFIDEPDINREKAINIRLNNASGEWDNEALENILEELELEEFNVELTGFNLDELIIDLDNEYEITETEYTETEEPSTSNADLTKDITEDEYEEDKMETTVQHGDLFKLGEHYLICGDATIQQEIEELLTASGERERIDMILTDVPYGMGLDTDYSVMQSNLKFYKEQGCNGGNKYHEGVVDDFQPQIIENIFNLNVKETFLWGADYYTDHLQNINEGSWIVWDKRSNDDTDFEKILQSDKMFGSCFELCWSKNKHKREIARIKWAGIFGTETEFDRKRHHPTQKPIKLSAWFINKYSNEYDVILDLTAGSGSTLLASEQTNRKCYAMEIEPAYCQIIINRWEEYTGKIAKKIN